MAHLNLIAFETSNSATAEKLKKQIKKYKADDPSIKAYGISMLDLEDEPITEQDKIECYCKIFASALAGCIKNPPYMDEKTQTYIAKEIKKEITKTFERVKKDPSIAEIDEFDFDEE